MSLAGVLNYYVNLLVYIRWTSCRGGLISSAHACVRACVRACVHACGRRAVVRACVRAHQ